MGCRSLLLPLVALLPAATGGANDAPLDRATLRGLKSVSVVLDRLDPELQKAGLTQADLQSRLESQLKATDVPVDPAASDFVGLRLTAVRGLRGPFAVSLTVGVYQPVLLVRDKNLRTSTATWEVETILMAEPKVLRQAALESVDELAARLATAWKSVNPAATAAPGPG